MVVTVIDTDNETHEINFRHLEYSSLMELMVNTYFTEIGECRGRGLCGTCIVEVIGEELRADKSPDEEHILKVNDRNDPKYRLACQLILDKKIDTMIFKEIE